MPNGARNTVLHCLVVLLVPGGCAADLARASSSAIGCPHDAIEISDISVGWSQMSWVARCNAVDFYCSGESDAACAPAVMVQSAPDDATTAKTEPGARGKPAASGPLAPASGDVTPGARTRGAEGPDADTEPGGPTPPKGEAAPAGAASPPRAEPIPNSNDAASPRDAQPAEKTRPQ